MNQYEVNEQLQKFLEEKTKKLEILRLKEIEIQEKNRKTSEFWGAYDVEKNFDYFDYELSYEIDPNIEVP